MNPTTPIIKYSGIQKAVLSLYREFLRASFKKDKQVSNNSSEGITNYIKSQFRLKAASVPKRDITKIETLLVRGKRQLEQIKEQETSGFTVFKPKSKQ